MFSVRAEVLLLLGVVVLCVGGVPESSHHHMKHESETPHLLGNDTENGQKRTLKSDKFKIACVSEHNSKRKVHEAPPLIWSDRLSESAQEWADHLAEIDEELKDPNQVHFGQNTFWIRPELPADAVCKAAVDEWYDEIKLYDFDATHGKRSFNPESSEDFTQLIWDGHTREVGVGLATSKTHRQYLVAHYYRKGNILGRYDAEVHLPYTARRDAVQIKRHPSLRDTVNQGNHVYNVVVNVTKQWTPLLKSRQSQPFKTLKMRLKKGIEDVFAGPAPPLKTFLLNSFKPGRAVLADIDLGFSKDSYDPIQTLKDALNTGVLGDLPVSKNFVKVMNKTGVFSPTNDDKNATDCKPLNSTKGVFIAPGVQLVNQTTCPGGICQTLLIHPPPPPAPAPATQASTSPYGMDPCAYQMSYPPQQITPPAFPCTAACPMNCCQQQPMMG